MRQMGDDRSGLAEPMHRLMYILVSGESSHAAWM